MIRIIIFSVTEIYLGENIMDVWDGINVEDTAKGITQNLPSRGTKNLR